MAMSEKIKKCSAAFVCSVFLCFVFHSALPAGTAAGAAAAGIATASGSAPQTYEKAAPRPAKKKKRLLVLGLAAAGVAAAAVLVLVLTKEDSSPDGDGDDEALHEDFASAASSNWKPRTAASWSVAGGAYQCSAGLAGNARHFWEWSTYNHAWSTANYTVEARMKVSLAKAGYGLMLSDTNDMNNANVYQFFFLGDGRYKVRKIAGYNLFESHNTGKITDFRDWTSGGAKATDWNTLTVTKNGANYALLVNGKSLFTFSDGAYDPRYVSIIAYAEFAAVKLDVDSINIDPVK
jgi:hypothetical protein